MSDDFLSRWSRRKRAGGDPPKLQPDAPPTVARAPADDSLPVGDREGLGPVRDTNESGVDLSKLPPLDSIDATSDVRAFLVKGVPPDLSREALRRAWVADPAIRDLVELAENTWDFNAADSIPGFASTLPVEEVRRLLAHVMGETLPDEAGTGGSVTRADTSVPLEHPEEKLGTETASGAEPEHSDGSPKIFVERDSRNAAVQKEEPRACDTEIRAYRRHGGALPDES